MYTLFILHLPKCILKKMHTYYRTSSGHRSVLHSRGQQPGCRSRDHPGPRGGSYPGRGHGSPHHGASGPVANGRTRSTEGSGVILKG